MSASEPGAATAHRTTVERAGFGLPGTPALFGASCSCGWQSESLWSDPEAAEDEASNHELEADRAD